LKPLYVSADTITEITAGKAAAPSVHDLLAQRREMIAARADETAERAAQRPDSRYLRRLAARARADVAEFETLIANMPAGSRLVPVWHAPMEGSDHQLRMEFRKHDGPDFLKMVANDPASSARLRAHGLGERGLAQMRRGRAPIDEEGTPLDVSIDHIDEVRGGGRLSNTRAPDPARPARGPRFVLNHVGNLRLELGQTHNHKNRVLQLQMRGQEARRTPQWVVMPVPERSGAPEDLVCPPQRFGHPLGGLKPRPYTPKLGLQCVANAVQRLQDALYDLRQDAIARKGLDLSADIAARENTTAAALALRQMYDPEERRVGLTALFNAIAAYSPGLQRQVDAELRPALGEVKSRLTRSFNECVKETSWLPESKRARLQDGFAKFYGNRQMRNLRSTVMGLPLAEAAELQERFAEIEMILKPPSCPSPKAA
jgi:hypothetical protein